MRRSLLSFPLGPAKMGTLAFLGIALLNSWGQSVPPPGEMARTTTSPPPAATPTKPAKTSRSAAANTNAAIERLTQTNQDLLELLKKQQAVLEDIQYDRRLQNRQIQLIEVRLEDTLQLNATLEAKIAKLEATGAAAPAPAAAAPDKTPAPAPAAVTIPPPPSTYLPPPESEGAPGTFSWHRLFTLSGEEAKKSDDFHIQGKQWRVVWHNQDRPGEVYKNTSALFISAFPKSDNIPKKVCSKLGSGGDSTELSGPGDYSLKIEASGGRWELAVEDFR